MKKQHFQILLTVTLMFLTFTLGFFLGRNTGRDPVVIEGVRTVPGDYLVPTTAAAVPRSTEDIEDLYDLVAPEVLNINLASQEQLMELPGIGEVLAQRILDYRKTHGDFASIEDLLLVEGIGQKKLESLMGYICTGG